MTRDLLFLGLWCPTRRFYVWVLPLQIVPPALGGSAALAIVILSEVAAYIARPVCGRAVTKSKNLSAIFGCLSLYGEPRKACPELAKGRLYVWVLTSFTGF